MAVWNRSRVAAWLLVGVLSSCASAAPSGGGANTAAAAAGATVALRPVDGEVSPEPRAGIGPFDSSILSMATAEGAIAISLANASSVRLLDSRTGQLTAELASPTPNVIGLKFSPGAKHLTAISRQQNEVYVWDVVARTPARTIRAANRVWGAVSLRGGARVVLAGEHGTLVLVAVDTGQVVRSLPVRETFKAESAPERLTVYGLALSRSGQWLAAVVGGHALILVDLERNDVIRSASGDAKMQLSGSEFSPDGRFALARGSSFSPPQMVEVGRRPGADDDGRPSHGACAGAMVAAGLIGYALCTVIYDDLNDDGGPPDARSTVDITGLAGEVMLWRVSDAQPIVVKSFGRTFEQMAWSADSTRVALIANTIQEREIVKRVLVYQRREITARSSALPPPVESLILGRPNNLLSSAIAADQATLFVERREMSVPAGAPPASMPRYTLERWPIPTLRPEVDTDDDEPTAPASPTGAAPRAP